MPIGGPAAAALVAAGGALGSLARYGISVFFTRAGIGAFPWATLVVNLAGGFAIGVVAAWIGPGGRRAGADGLWLFLAVGFCGGFTTFSAFGLQTLELARAGEGARAAANVIVSVAGALLATAAGLAVGGAVVGGGGAPRG